MGSLHRLKVSPHEPLLLTKRKIIYLQWRKLADTPLSQVVKVSSPGVGQADWYRVLPHEMLLVHTWLLWCVCPEFRAHSQGNSRQTQIEEYSPKELTRFREKCQGHDKGRRKDCFRVKAANNKWQQNVMCDPKLDPGLEKSHEMVGEIWRRLVD